MEHRDRSEDDLDIPDLYTERMTSAVQNREFESQYNGVYYGDDNVCDSEGISVAFSAIEHPWCEDGRHPAHNVVVATVPVYPDQERG
jgi:hypothetical protein